jgi:predicted AAA+ superfamily ATPase
LLFYKVTFYDTKGKNVLKTKSKYYAGDLGLLSSQTSFDASKNRGYRLENLVYLNLLSKGYEVYTSADRFEREIDFVCIKDNRISYYQVCSELNDKNYQREAGSLLAVKDNNHKMILCEEDNASITSDGIKRMNIFH